MAGAQVTQPLVAIEGLYLAGGRTGSCSVSAFILFSPPLSSSFYFLSPSAHSPSFTFSPFSFLLFSHQPQFPPPLILPLKRISCFLILSSSSELRITLGSSPLPPPSPPAGSLPLRLSRSSPLPFPSTSPFFPLFSPAFSVSSSPLTDKARSRSSGKVSTALVWEVGAQRPRSELDKIRVD